MTRYIAAGMVSIALTGCATHAAEKPLLTAGVFHRVTAACGATNAQFHHQRNKKLPYGTIVIHEDAQQVADQPNPTLACVDTGLKPYRHDFIGFNLDRPSAE